ncbi:nucleoside diphosphate kinase regulator [Reyranella sp.]|uniref:nucleoside diphosphate kinase regulator n=1 Tax=Reyranella sp. TaxID=1929291 RepID=UPI003784C4A9
MSKAIDVSTKPRIVVTEADYIRLTNLVAAVRERSPDVADELQIEMARASIADADSISPDVVRMGSIVTFQSDSASRRRVELVFPVDADITKGKVSILTPIGTALIGLSVGQSIEWRSRDGRSHQLAVVSVEPPEG